MKTESELRRFKQSRVVVSYYQHPRLQELYPGWLVLDLSRAKNLSVQNRRGGTTDITPEVLLLNGESYTEPALNEELF